MVAVDKVDVYTPRLVIRKVIIVYDDTKSSLPS